MNADKILKRLDKIENKLDSIKDNSIPAIMTVSQAASFLNISESKLRRLIANNKVPYRKIDGTIIRLHKKELLLWYGTGKTSFTKRDKSKLEILE